MKNRLVLIAKNEGHLIEDFIIYHLSIGFEEIIIFDDQSFQPVSDSLAGLPMWLSELVKIYRVPDSFDKWRMNPPDCLYDEEIFSTFRGSKQRYLSNYAMKHFCDQSDWISFLDADEFLWLGKYQTVSELKNTAQSAQFSGFVFDMLMYGHSFHLVPPDPRNLCAFLWRSGSIHGHGKFMALIADLEMFENPHLPKMKEPTMVCDMTFTPRVAEFIEVQAPYSCEVPHVKHFIIQDVDSCFSRRIQSRISTQMPINASHQGWIDRSTMVNDYNDVQDLDLACTIIQLRSRLGLPIISHIEALESTVRTSMTHQFRSGILDVEEIRKELGLPSNLSHPETLFHYFSSSDKAAHLRFVPLPTGFNAVEYANANPDLRRFNERQLCDHYARVGRAEGRPTQ